MNKKDVVIQNRLNILNLAYRFGVRSIRLFGSVAREEDKSTSDIDFLIEMDENYSLLEFIAFKQSLEDLLESTVDLAEVSTLHPQIRERVLKEAIAL